MNDTRAESNSTAPPLQPPTPHNERPTLVTHTLIDHTQPQLKHTQPHYQLRIHGRFHLWTSGIFLCLSLCHLLLSIATDEFIQTDTDARGMRNRMAGKNSLQWILLCVGFVCSSVAFTLLIGRFFGWRVFERRRWNFKLIIIVLLAADVTTVFTAIFTYTSIKQYAENHALTNAAASISYGSSYLFALDSACYTLICIVLLTWHEVDEQMNRRSRRQEEKEAAARKRQAEEQRNNHPVNGEGEIDAAAAVAAITITVEQEKNENTVTPPTSSSPLPPSPPSRPFSVVLHHDYLSPPQRRLVFSICLLFFWIYPAGGLCFSYIEGWGIREACDFCIVTISTIGWGNVIPHTPLGRAFTVVYFPVGFAALGFTVRLVWQVVLMRINSRIRKASRVVNNIMRPHKWWRKMFDLPATEATAKKTQREREREQEEEEEIKQNRDLHSRSHSHPPFSSADSSLASAPAAAAAADAAPLHLSFVELAPSLPSRMEQKDKRTESTTDNKETQQQARERQQEEREMEQNEKQKQMKQTNMNPLSQLTISHHSTDSTPSSSTATTPTSHSTPLHSFRSLPSSRSNSVSTAASSALDWSNDLSLASSTRSLAHSHSQQPSKHGADTHIDNNDKQQQMKTQQQDISEDEGEEEAGKHLIRSSITHAQRPLPVHHRHTQSDSPLSSKRTLLPPHTRMQSRHRRTAAAAAFPYPLHMQPTHDRPPLDPVESTSPLSPIMHHHEWSSRPSSVVSISALRSRRSTTSVQLFLACIFVFLFAFASAGVFAQTENWSYSDALWFVFQCVAVIGYGDLFPTKHISSAFFLWFILFGLGAVIYVLSLISEILTERFEEQVLRRKQIKAEARRREELIRQAQAQEPMFAPPEELIKHAKKFNTFTEELIDSARQTMDYASRTNNLIDENELTRLTQRYQSAFTALLRAEERRKFAFEQAWLKGMQRMHDRSGSRDERLEMGRVASPLQRYDENEFDWSHQRVIEEVDFSPPPLFMPPSVSSTRSGDELIPHAPLPFHLAATDSPSHTPLHTHLSLPPSSPLSVIPELTPLHSSLHSRSARSLDSSPPSLVVPSSTLHRALGSSDLIHAQRAARALKQSRQQQDTGGRVGTGGYERELEEIEHEEEEEIAETEEAAVTHAQLSVAASAADSVAPSTPESAVDAAALSEVESEERFEAENELAQFTATLEQKGKRKTQQQTQDGEEEEEEQQQERQTSDVEDAQGIRITESPTKQHEEEETRRRKREEKEQEQDREEGSAAESEH